MIICDNASWHKAKSQDWGRFEPLFLPPYSPDFNPIERLWLLIKAEWFTDFIAKDREALVARLDRALVWAMKRSDDNQSTCAMHRSLLATGFRELLFVNAHQDGTDPILTSP